MQAAKFGEREVVDYLLSLGSSPDDVLIGGAMGNQKQMVDYAISLGVEYWGLMFGAREAISGGHLEMADYLLKQASPSVKVLRVILENPNFYPDVPLERQNEIRQLLLKKIAEKESQ